MSRRHGYWLLASLILLLATGCRSQPKPKTPVSNLTGTLDIQVPDSAVAGEAIVITVHSTSIPDEGTPITFLAMNGLGQRVYQSTFSAQIALFTVPVEDTQQAGLMTIMARSGQAYGETSLNVQPAKAVSPLFLVVGPRTVVANSRKQNMTAVVANDVYGNALLNGNIDLQVLFADGTFTKHTVAINHLVAWSWLDNTTASGKIRLSASMGDASAPENDLDAVAGSPQKFGITVDPPTADADGRQLIMLRSDAIRDVFGNIVPDGTQVMYVVQTPSGETRLIPTYIIDGVARTPLQAPQTAGSFKVWAIVEGIMSDTVTIPFTDQNVAKDFQLVTKTDATIGAIILTAGPVSGTLGQLMPDGTQVHFSLTDPVGNRQLLMAETKNGYAEVEIRLLALRAGNYTAEASIGSKNEKVAFNVH